MPIGTGIVYNVGDLILSQVSSSGTAFLETKIAAATSSLIYFDSNARINSASLNSITVGTASYVSGSRSIITNLTASNISASGTSSFGYVGIGTNSPAYKLDLQNTSSTARLGNAIVGAFPVDGNYALFGHNSLNHSSSATNYALLQESNGSTYLNAIGQPIYFRIANTNKMILNSSGQFGIGTTSPITGYLDVRSNQTKSVAGPTSIAFFGSGDGSNPLGLVLNHESSSGVKMVGLVGTEYGSSGNNIKINETLHVQYTGGVGIGTISPSAKFQVVQTAAVYPMAKFTDTVFAESAYLSAFTNAGGNTLGFSGLECSQTNSTTRRLWIGTDSPYAVPEAFIGTPDNLPLVFYTSGSARMFISSSGNVGIGLTNPAYKLDVNGSINTSTFMFVSYQYGNAFPLQLNASNFLKANDYYYGMTINSGDVNYISGKFLINGGTYKRVELYGYENSIGYIPTVIPGGNVGIGTINPAYLLDVSGSTRHGYRAADNHYFTGSVNISGSLTLNGTFAPTSISASGTSSFGYVGIGTTNPTQKLHIQNGYLLIDTNATVGSGLWMPDTNGNPSLRIVTDQSSANFSSIINNWGANTNSGVMVGTVRNDGTAFQVRSGVTVTSGFANDDGTTRFTVNGDGNVGIGTTSPANKLHVAGLMTQDSSIVYSKVNTITTNNPIRITIPFTKINTGADFIVKVKAIAMANNSSGVNYLDYVGYSGYTFNFNTNLTTIEKYGNVTVNSYVSASSATAGNLYVELDGVDGFTQDSNWTIQTNILGNSMYSTFDSGSITTFVTSISEDSLETSFNKYFGGNVGIGTTNATEKLTVYGELASYKTGADTIQTQVYLANTPNTRAFNIQLNSAGTGLDLWSYNSANAWLRHTTFDYDGKVGIGTATSILGKLQLDSGAAPFYGPATGSATPNGILTLGSIAGDVVNTFGVDASTTAYSWIQSRKATGATFYNLALNPNGGSVGIGTVTPAAKLEITGSSNSALLNIKSPISGAILYVSGSGAVGIGTSAVGAFTLQVSGSFGATTKSFIIDHPTKEGKKLMYGSLESPYHGIRLTGRDTIKDGKCKVELPDYMYKLILHDSINIQLTGIKCNKTLYVDEINIPETYFTIAYDKGVFESYKDYDFFWDFTAIRADVPELNTEL